MLKGYGIKIENEKVDLAKIRLMANKYLLKDRKRLDFPSLNRKEERNLGLFFNSYSCLQTGEKGFGAVISNSMSMWSGMSFEYYKEGEKTVVLLRENMPWGFGSEEKKVSKMELDCIFAKFMKEAGIAAAADYLTVS